MAVLHSPLTVLHSPLTVLRTVPWLCPAVPPLCCTVPPLCCAVPQLCLPHAVLHCAPTVLQVPHVIPLHHSPPQQVTSSSQENPEQPHLHLVSWTLVPKWHREPDSQPIL